MANAFRRSGVASATTTTTSSTGRQESQLSLQEKKDVQRRLTELGYVGRDGRPLASDGDFRANTRFAIEEFQRRNALTVDGIAGPLTRQKLFSASAVRAASIIGAAVEAGREVIGAAVAAVGGTGTGTGSAPGTGTGSAPGTGIVQQGREMVRDVVRDVGQAAGEGAGQAIGRTVSQEAAKTALYGAIGIGAIVLIGVGAVVYQSKKTRSNPSKRSRRR